MVQLLRSEDIIIDLIKSAGAYSHFRWRAQGYDIEI